MQIFAIAIAIANAIAIAIAVSNEYCLSLFVFNEPNR